MSTEVRVTDPITGGQKGTKPERFSLLPWDALSEVARVFAFGAAKYEADNYLRGYPWRWSLDALHRHVALVEQGEDYDAESGLLHLAHATFHCLALIAFKLRGLGTDDRWRPAPAPAAPTTPPSVWQPRLGERARIRPDAGVFNAGKEGTILSKPDWQSQYDWLLSVGGDVPMCVRSKELEPPQGWQPGGAP